MENEKYSKLAKRISELALNLLIQVKENRQINGSDLEETYYSKLLCRLKEILLDISNILESERQLYTSSFILMRVLLDDFLRLLVVYYSNEPKEEISKLQADALMHFIKLMEESVKYNQEYFNEKHPQLSTNNTLVGFKNEIINNNTFKELFINQQNLKLKSPGNIANIFENKLNTKSLKEKYAHSYSNYKYLTRYVHYGHLLYPYHTEEEDLVNSVKVFEESLRYCYNMFQILFAFFQKKYPSIVWKENEATEYFQPFRGNVSRRGCYEA